MFIMPANRTAVSVNYQYEHGYLETKHNSFARTFHRKSFSYDGHGSVRRLANTTGALISGQLFTYDAYGVMLGGNPRTPQNPGSPSTNLLYAGEQFDTDMQIFKANCMFCRIS